MRHFVLPLVLASAATTGILVAAACSSKTGSGSADLADEDTARAALQILGAPETPPPPGQQVSCGFTGCHSINPVTVRNWKGLYDKAIAYLSDPSHSNTDKINFLRANPADPRTDFTPEKIGIMTAGVQLALGANVNPTDTPLTYAQGQLMAQIFQGQDDLYAAFRNRVLMPVEPDIPRLTAQQFEMILSWFQKGLPDLDQLIPENRPTSCTDSFDGLSAHASAVKTKNWTVQNASTPLPMFACPPPDPASTTSPDATQCFKNQLNGQDVFPLAANTPYGKNWSQDGTDIRILRSLTWPSSWWVRSSADGRFIATGGGMPDPNNQWDGAQAVDLQPALTGGKRDIHLDSDYDPEFFPDNNAFMFQAERWSNGARLCAQSLLENPATTEVTFGEPECSTLSDEGEVYQTVGELLGNSSIGDRYVLYSTHTNDPGSYSFTQGDTTPSADQHSTIRVYAYVAAGNDVSSGYQMNNYTDIPSPNAGDTMMSRTSTMISSRVTGAGGTQQGYQIQNLIAQVPTAPGQKYSFSTTPMGQVCMKGNKANFSYDERFLATHHYYDSGDVAPSSDPRYQTLGTSNIVIADFVTGKKQPITNMAPGQFALYPHFRSDGWVYFLVQDQTANPINYYIVAADWAIQQEQKTPTP